MANKLRITLVRSPIGYEKSQGETVKALGLRRMHYSVVREDTPTVRGQINKIRHLIQVDELKEAE